MSDEAELPQIRLLIPVVLRFDCILVEGGIAVLQLEGDLRDTSVCNESPGVVPEAHINTEHRTHEVISPLDQSPETLTDALYLPLIIVFEELVSR